jgi:hypothetical protein
VVFLQDPEVGLAAAVHRAERVVVQRRGHAGAPLARHDVEAVQPALVDAGKADEPVIAFCDEHASAKVTPPLPHFVVRKRIEVGRIDVRQRCDARRTLDLEKRVRVGGAGVANRRRRRQSSAPSSRSSASLRSNPPP